MQESKIKVLVLLFMTVSDMMYNVLYSFGIELIVAVIAIKTSIRKVTSSWLIVIWEDKLTLI